MATQERQRLLNDQYYFLCQCEGCTVPTQQQQEEEEGEGPEGKGQWSGLLCGKCKGALKVGVHSVACDLCTIIYTQMLHP